MTKREFLEKVIAEVENAELKNFAKGEIARMDKANANRKGKPTKEQKANAEFRAQAWGEIAKLEEKYGVSLNKEEEEGMESIVVKVTVPRYI